MKNKDDVVLQLCPDHVAADILASYLQAESIPARVHNLSPLPGLEQGSEVLVPARLLYRAKQLLAQQLPSDEELTQLATGCAAPAADGEGGER